MMAHKIRILKPYRHQRHFEKKTEIKSHTHIDIWCSINRTKNNSTIHLFKLNFSLFFKG